MELLNVLIKKPIQVSEKSGFIFLLHGYGSNEKDLFSFSEYLPKDNYIISFRAPLKIGPDSFSWYDISINEKSEKFSDINQAKQSIKIIIENIDYHLNLYPSKGTRSILGFSQGAILSWAIGLANPNKINKLLPLSGFLNEDILDNIHPDAFKLKCFISHGIYDPIIPIQLARDTIEKIKKFKLEVN